MSRQTIRAFFADSNNADTILYWIGAVLVALVLTGVLGATSAHAQSSGNIYGSYGGQVNSPVTRGVVLQTRIVKVETEQNTRYVGAASGATLGGAIGVALGRKSSSGAQAALGIIGAAIGGLGGSKAAEHFGGTRAVEYIVQVIREDGHPANVIAITQPDPADVVNAGEAVFLINTTGAWRVVRMQGNFMPQPPVQPAAPAVAPQPAQPTVLHLDMIARMQ